MDAGLLHHPARERRRERRQAERAVAEHLDELAAEPEEEHRPELRIDAAADDELVAGALDHRLDRDALEVLGAVRRGHRGLDRRVGLADGRRDAARSRRTPPTSVLWVIVCERSLSTTG